MNQFVPGVVITELQLYKPTRRTLKTIAELEVLELSHEEDVFSLTFASLDFTFPQKNQYAYKLEGFDDDWVSAGYRRFVTYTNLDPGSYVFRVRGSNNDGIWNMQGATLRIEIAPPFWATWWFRFLIVCLLVLGTVLAFRLRVRNMRVRNRELQEAIENRTRELEIKTQKLEATQKELVKNERLAALGQLTATVSHELRNPLGTIRSSVFSISERLDQTSNADLFKILERAERNVIRCDKIIEELLDYTRAKELNYKIVDLDQWIQKFFDEFELPEGISLKLDLSAGVDASIDVERFRRCLINLVENAQHAILDVTHTNHEKCITVQTKADGRIEINIRDTGIGISEAHLQRVFEPLYSTKNFGFGLGLPIVSQIMELHDGGITITSESNAGTNVMLWLPLIKKGIHHAES